MSQLLDTSPSVPQTVLIEVSTELLETWFTRDNAGNRLSMDLGVPRDYALREALGDVLPIYVPTITTHPDDNPWSDQEGKTE